MIHKPRKPDEFNDIMNKHHNTLKKSHDGRLVVYCLYQVSSEQLENITIGIDLCEDMSIWNKQWNAKQMMMDIEMNKRFLTYRESVIEHRLLEPDISQCPNTTHEYKIKYMRKTTNYNTIDYEILYKQLECIYCKLNVLCLYGVKCQMCRKYQCDYTYNDIIINPQHKSNTIYKVVDTDFDGIVLNWFISLEQYEDYLETKHREQPPHRKPRLDYNVYLIPQCVKVNIGDNIHSIITKPEIYKGTITILPLLQEKELIEYPISLNHI